MKIFVAGASGAAGRLLLPMLREAGHTVTALTRSEFHLPMLRELGAQPVVGDVLNRDTVFAALEAARPDVVIHQLTDLTGRDFAANNRLRIEGTRHLVDASRAVGVERMIAQSFYGAYGPGSGPAREEDALDVDAPPPRGSTARGVQALEQAVAEMPAGVVLRYALFYGPGTWYTRESWTTDQIRRGEITATDAVVSFIHVMDAARAALLALDWPSGVWNIADDEPAPGTEWVPLYAQLVGAPPPPVQPGRQPWERGESNAKARALGWRPLFPTWREGFAHELVPDM